MQNLFRIDGRYFNVRIPENGIKRTFSVLDGDNAKRATSGRMIRDIIGTYYNYTITLDTSELDAPAYDGLYEIISAPQDSHTIQVPYGQSNLTFEAYITGGEDILQIVKNGEREWSGLQMQFIAMAPQRT